MSQLDPADLGAGGGPPATPPLPPADEAVSPARPASAIPRTLLALAAGAAAIAFVALDPARTIHPDALATFARGALPALLAVAAALGAGGAVLRATAPDALDAPGGWLAALGVGVALQGALLGLFACMGALGPIAAISVLVATGAGWAARPRVTLPRVPTTALLLGGLLLLPGLVDALAPPTDTDELYYHLSLPRRMLEQGGFLGGFLTPDGSRPMPVHLVFAALMSLGGEAAPRLWHLALSAALVLGVRTLAEARFGPGRGDLPALALLGSYSWLREAGLAYNNHLVALYLLLAADALLARRPVLLGWMCGFALAVKYTAAPAAAALCLLAAWDHLRADPRRVALAALATLAPLAPWWLRNVADGLHPLFPFAGWPAAGEGGADFVFVYPEKYGLGHDLVATLRLPLDLLFRAEIDSFVFLGRVSLLWGALGLAASWAARRDGAVRRLVFVVAVGFVGWAMGAQIVRYLLPLFGIAALAGGALPRRWPAWLLLAASLPANLAPTLRHAASRAAVVSGQEDADTFLAREVSAWGALRFLREHVPADAAVAMLFSWQGYWVPQPAILGSVEDHVPTRYWLWRNGDAALSTLADLGVTHLLVGDVKFLKKSYGFLGADVLRDQFNGPEERLRELLLRDATRLYAADRWEVWRLDPQPGPERLDDSTPSP